MTRNFTTGLLTATFLVFGVATASAGPLPQRARIAQGVQSGSLTPGEASVVRQQQRQTRRVAKRDAVSGGGISPREARQLNRLSNRNSQTIYRLKHNNRVR